MALKGDKPILYDNQYRDLIEPSIDSPERKLFRAFLHRIVLDYLFFPTGSSEYRSSYKFLFNEESYKDCDLDLSILCEILEVDKNSFLAKLKKEKSKFISFSYKDRIRKRYVN